MKTLACFIFMALLGANARSQVFTSPRATAVGGYIGVADDLYGLDWNIAGTAFSDKNIEVAFSSIDVVNGIEGFENVRFALRPWKRHVIAFRKTPSFLKDYPIRKFPLNPPPDKVTPLNFLTKVSFKEDLAVGYAFRFTPRFAAGFDLKRGIYANRLSSSRFWSLNVSGHFKFNERLSVGVVARNLHNFHYRKYDNRLGFTAGDSLRVIAVDFEAFQSVYNTPARRLDLGVAARPLKSLLLTLDLFSDGGYGVGFEWQAPGSIFLRSAISHKSDLVFKPKKVFGAAWGIGWRYRNLARLDFAYYFPYGGRDSGVESTTFGEFEILPVKNDVLLLSIAFFLP